MADDRKGADAQDRESEAVTSATEEASAPATQAPAGPAPSPTWTMPSDFSIALTPGYGADVSPRDAAQGERRQPMRGYEDTYVDIIDYIVRVTHRIWEDQDVGYIYDTYAPGCRVYDDSGMQYGVERVVEGTVQSIAAFPDVRHYADEIVWAGDEEQGFVTSHRALNIGHHLGTWRWGPPTGRKINLWVIANCVSKENVFYEEWVLHNIGAKLQQLGYDLAACARTYGNEGGVRGLEDRELSEVERLVGGRAPDRYPAASGEGFDVEHTVRALFHETYNRRDLSAIDRIYASNVRWYGATNRVGYGRAKVRAMARNLLATFPDLGLHVDEVYWMGNEAEGFRVSVRWTAVGTHRGYALYGAPTGRRVHLWGISQLYIRGGRIVEDWMLFNEFDVLAQLFKDDPAPAFG
jgi:predicted ester cyclase